MQARAKEELKSSAKKVVKLHELAARVCENEIDHIGDGWAA